MLRTYFVIGTYNHLPDGLDDSTFESIYQTSYRPFLLSLYRFPEIQAALYYSGSLLRRLETRHAEFLMLLEQMTSRRQIELLGGGYHAPVMPLIPGSDRLGQIELLTTYLRKSFGKRPRGCWLTEYAWEPWLASTLQTSGMDYTFLSTAQFAEAAGILPGSGQDELTSIHTINTPATTEDQGRTVTVLPVLDCAWNAGHPVGLVDMAERAPPAPVNVIMAPGESIGTLWEASGLESPDLYMERTFAWFRRNALQTETTTPSRYLKARPVTRRLYFPGSASMSYHSAVRPGSGYSTCSSLKQAVLATASASRLYSRMHYVHLLIGQLRGDKSRKKSALEDLWKGQEGDAYWRSARGGIADPAIRESALRSLIDAELTTRIPGVFKPGFIRADIDFDNLREYIYQSAELNAHIHPVGARLVELEALASRRNLCNVFTATPDLDTSRASCFVDRLYETEPPADRVTSPWTGDACSLSSHQYDEALAEPGSHGVAFSLAKIVGGDTTRRPMEMKKRYLFRKTGTHVLYELTNRSDAPLEFWLGVEFNLSAGPEGFTDMSIGGAQSAVPGPGMVNDCNREYVARLQLKSAGPVRIIELNTTLPMLASAAPVVDAGFTQGLAVLCLWKVTLEPDIPWATELTLSFKDQQGR